MKNLMVPFLFLFMFGLLSSWAWSHPHIMDAEERVEVSYDDFVNDLFRFNRADPGVFLFCNWKPIHTVLGFHFEAVGFFTTDRSFFNAFDLADTIAYVNDPVAYCVQIILHLQKSFHSLTC